MKRCNPGTERKLKHPDRLDNRRVGQNNCLGDTQEKTLHRPNNTYFVDLSRCRWFVASDLYSEPA